MRPPPAPGLLEAWARKRMAHGDEAGARSHEGGLWGGRGRVRRARAKQLKSSTASVKLRLGNSRLQSVSTFIQTVFQETDRALSDAEASMSGLLVEGGHRLLAELGRARVGHVGNLPPAAALVLSRQTAFRQAQRVPGGTPTVQPLLERNKHARHVRQSFAVSIQVGVRRFLARLYVECLCVCHAGLPSGIRTSQYRTNRHLVWLSLVWRGAGDKETVRRQRDIWAEGPGRTGTWHGLLNHFNGYSSLHRYTPNAGKPCSCSFTKVENRVARNAAQR